VEFYNQIVLPIKGTVKNEYFIIFAKDDAVKRQWFVSAKDCLFVISEDDNGSVRYEIRFDKNNAQEIRTVPSYKKLFLITENGVLVSRRTNAVLSQTLSDSGYFNHATKIGGRKGKAILVRVHRCVAEAFVENPLDKPFVNHLDGVKTNNHRSNLEWVTNQENIKHAFQTGLIVPRYGLDNPNSILTEEDIEYIKVCSNEEKMSGRAIARSLGVNKSTVERVLKGKRYASAKHR
jgi:hypothetical protein